MHGVHYCGKFFIEKDVLHAEVPLVSELTYQTPKTSFSTVAINP